MPPDDTKRLGYGGSSEIDDVQVLIASGGFERQTAVSYLEPLSIPATTVSRSRVKHADGIAAYSANVSFDVTQNFLAALTTSRLFARRYTFDVGIHDGEDAENMADCYVQSLSLNGSAGGLITATLSAISASAPASSLGVDNDFIRDDTPLGYWRSGNTDVRDWTLTMNQAAEPVYVNESTTTPRYIRVGLISFSLQVTTYEAVQTHNDITIATASFTLSGDTASEGFQFVGVTELGQYTHLFETSADFSIGSGDTIIT